jgi:hypothetical protein
MVVTLVSCFLFDALGFTHVSYMSLFVGAMILVLRGHEAAARATSRIPALAPAAA